MKNLTKSQNPTRFKKSWIPNTAGFKFVAIKRDGSKQKVIVQKHADGTHYVRGIKWEEFEEWENL
jgi:hypothetical protein